jgi:hypothetical protein
VTVSAYFHVDAIVPTPEGVEVRCSVSNTETNQPNPPDGASYPSIASNTEGDLVALELVMYFQVDPGLVVGEHFFMTGHFNAKPARPVPEATSPAPGGAT